jgi:hypothetical protein
MVTRIREVPNSRQFNDTLLRFWRVFLLVDFQLLDL